MFGREGGDPHGFSRGTALSRRFLAFTAVMFATVNPCGWAMLPSLPVFLIVVSTSLTATGFAGRAAMFLSYASGMAVVLIGVAVGAALLKGTVAEWFRGLLPYVHRIGAVLLVLAGAYLIWYQGRYLPLILAGF